MSPEAIAARLEELDQLYELSQSLLAAREIGAAETESEEPKSSPT